MTVIYFYIYSKSNLPSKGPFIYWSKRIGRNNSIFYMPKVRTMYEDTPQKATHLLDQPFKYITNLVGF